MPDEPIPAPTPSTMPPAPDTPLVTASSLAYGGSGDTVSQFRTYRLERGTPFKRAGQIIVPKSKFGAMGLFGGVSQTATTTGNIDPSKPGFLQIGSVPPTVSTVAFTFTATTTSTVISWPNTPIRRADGTSTTIPSGQLSVQNLSASTKYFFYPFWSEAHVAIGWVVTSAAVGCPAVAFTTQTDALLQASSLAGMVPLGPISNSTPATGTTTTTGGYGGGGGVSATGCPIAGTKIEWLGDSPHSIVTCYNSEWVYISTEDNFKLIATPEHPVFHELKGKVALSGLKIGDNIITKAGLSKVRCVEQLQREDMKQVVSGEQGHLFWANGILSHNFKNRPVSLT